MGSYLSLYPESKKEREQENFLQKYLIIANIIFDVIFIAIIVFYSIIVKLSGDIITCDGITNIYVTIANVLAIGYKTLYAVLCITLTILLCVYADLLVKLVKKSPGKSSKKNTNKRVKKLLLLAIGCALFLILQTIVLILSVVLSFQNVQIDPWAILLEITVLELIPSVVLCYMFGERSIKTLESLKRKSTSINNNSTRGISVSKKNRGSSTKNDDTKNDNDDTKNDE